MATSTTTVGAGLGISNLGAAGVSSLGPMGSGNNPSAPLGLVAPPPAPLAGTSQKQAKYLKINSVEQALRHGVPVISPLHAPRTQIWLKQTAAPQSQLSDIARHHLYCDYMFLLGEVARDKLESKKRRKGNKKEKVAGATLYHAKKLQDLYKCSLKTIQRIIKLGKTAETTDAKKRPGRSRAITSADISAANLLQHQMGPGMPQ